MLVLQITAGILLSLIILAVLPITVIYIIKYKRMIGYVITVSVIGFVLLYAGAYVLIETPVGDYIDNIGKPDKVYGTGELVYPMYNR